MQAELPPPSTFRRGKAFTNAIPSRKLGGGNSACKKKHGPGSARAARGGVLSRPDERNRVKTKSAYSLPASGAATV